LDAQLAESRSEILFSCCDDGAGISPEVLPSIFTEFAGAGGRSGDSSGLGLAFCKAVVEAHGGRIWCESMPEQGARFFFTIPLSKESDDDQ
jgi:signal transduction histidine kinase